MDIIRRDISHMTISFDPAMTFFDRLGFAWSVIWRLRYDLRNVVVSCEAPAPPADEGKGDGSCS